MLRSGETLGQVMRKTVSSWYRFILRISLSVYMLGYLMIVVKLLLDGTPEKLKTLKESVGRFIIMFVVTYFLSLIMIAILEINAEGLDLAKRVGSDFSGIDMVNDEYDLYETALSKAYELADVPGFIGLIMYLLLVYYTYKFTFVYAKRYINVIILILIAPVIFVVSTIKRIITGVNDGRIKKWFKEFIFNVIIQTFHAVAYAILIGLTLKMSDNNENLIGALLTLVMFGFIFRIDALIRKVFNFVGGSTNIKRSRALSTAIDAGGNIASAGIGAIGGGIEGGVNAIEKTGVNFAENIDQFGMKDGLKQGFKDTGRDISNGLGEARATIKQKTINVGNDIKDRVSNKIVDTKDNIVGSVKDTYQEVKSDVKDYKNIMNGERVKSRLTEDEIIAEAHNIKERRGLEGLRQDVRMVGSSFASVGRYSSKQLEKVYKGASKRVKTAISETEKEMLSDIEKLDNSVEMLKRLPKVVKNLKKKQKFVKTANGMNIDVTNTMMTVVDTDVSPEELVNGLKESLDDGVDIAVYTFENVGAQTFLSPAIGSPRMGMAVLAECNYEEMAEHRIEEAVTGVKRKRKIIRKPSNLQSKRAIRKAAKGIKKNEIVNKSYQFSRFNMYSADKITRKMLKKSRENNRYLVVINKAYEDVRVDKLTARGTIGKAKTEVQHAMRATRKNVVKSVRQMKLSQLSAIAKNKELTKKTKMVQMANNVAGQVMTAANTIKLGFTHIDNMTPGQAGLRKMIKEGKATELPSGLVVLRQNATVAQKVAATGLVSTEKPNTVIQFVVTNEGKIVPQIVTMEGKIIAPAMIKPKKETPEQKQVREAITQMFTSYIAQSPELMQKFQVQPREGETQEQAVFRAFMTQVVVQYNQNVEAGVIPEVQVQEGETREQAIIRQFITQAVSEFSVAQETGEKPQLQIREGETQEQFEMRKIVFEMFTGYVEQVSTIQRPEVGNQERVIFGILPETAQKEVQTEFVQLFTGFIESPVNTVQTPEFVQFLNNIEPQEGQTKEQAVIEVLMTQVITEYRQEVADGVRPEIQVREGETVEQAIVRQFFTETIVQYNQAVQLGENPIVQLQEGRTEEQVILSQFIIQIYNEMAPTQEKVEALEKEVVATPEQEQIKQFFTQIITEYQQAVATGEAKQIEVQENETIEQAIIREFVTEAVMQEIKVEQPEVQPEVQQEKPVRKRRSQKRQQEQEAKQEMQEEQKEEFIQKMVKIFLSPSAPQETIVAQNTVKTSEEKMEEMEQIVQHIVTLDGNIVEQVVNLEDETIEVNDFKIVDKGGQQLVRQIQEVVTNEDLGLQEDASVEEKMESFESLLEDVQRSAATSDLLEQVIEEVAPEQKEMDELLVGAMHDAGISTVQELKQTLSFDTEIPSTFMPEIPGITSKEELREKQENFKKVVADRLVTTGLISSVEAEDDDILGNAIDVLNDRVEEITATGSDALFETAAEMERTRIAEQLIGKGEFTVASPPADADIDATVEGKVEDLSDLLKSLARESLEEITRYPRELIDETIDAATDVYEKMAGTEETTAEAEYVKELKKAEKKWAKKHGTDADETIVEKYVTKKKGQEEEKDAVVKISIRFYGAVRTQGQTITLSNRYSIKDFYDRADKLDGASLEKTQQKFLQDNGAKLKQMQLLPFSFAKNPVEEMDEWSIYVVTASEDVSDGDKEREEKVIPEPIPETTSELMERYSIDLKSIFKKFIEEKEVTSFDDIHNEQENRRELTRRIRMFLYRHGEKDEQSKAIDIVSHLHKKVEFKNILVDVNKDRIAEANAQEAVKKAKTKVKVTSKENAEKEAAKTMTEEEVKQFKKDEKSNLMDQVLDDTMTKQEEEATVSPDLNDLLNQIKENKVFVSIDEENSKNPNRRTLQYRTDNSEGDIMQ